eukprot:scaffold55357_cov30-Tisochrysis_lutea.AAC.2
MAPTPSHRSALAMGLPPLRWPHDPWRPRAPQRSQTATPGLATQQPQQGLQHTSTPNPNQRTNFVVL